LNCFLKETGCRLQTMGNNGNADLPQKTGIFDPVRETVPLV